MKLRKFKEVERLLINIDMINGFINFGAMHDNGIAEIIKPQIELINECQKDNDYLIFIKEGHKEESTEFAKYPKHCIKGTAEAEIVDALMPFVKNNQYEKNSTSAIFAKNFLEDIASMVNLKEIIIMGCCTDICVLNLAVPLANYFDEINKQIDIIVPKNVVQTYNAPNHSREEYNEIAFKLMVQAGIKVVDSYNQ